MAHYSIPRDSVINKTWVWIFLVVFFMYRTHTAIRKMAIHFYVYYLYFLYINI